MEKWKKYLNSLNDHKEKQFFQKAREFIREKKIQKSQIALLILSIGAIIFLSIPNGKQIQSLSSKGGQKNAKITNSLDKSLDAEDTDEIYISSKEAELEQMLSKVKGVGKVKVMITLQDTGQQIVNKDENETKESEQNADASGALDDAANQSVREQVQRQEQTVILEDGTGKQRALVTKQLQPEIRGVVVICEGGDNPQVISDVSYAVEVLFSVSAHKVKVMKMIS